MGRLVLLIGEDYKVLARQSAWLMRAGFSSAPVRDLPQALSYLKKARFDFCLVVHHQDSSTREWIESRLKSEQTDIPVLWLDQYRTAAESEQCLAFISEQLRLTAKRRNAVA